MSNGDRKHTSQIPPGALIPLPLDDTTVITPEMYTTNMARLEAMKSAIAVYEERNKQGYMRYIAEKQQLEAEVERGRLAAQRLQELNARMASAGQTIALGSSTAGPSSMAQYLISDASQTPKELNELPSTARIVELPSSSQGSPQVGQSSGPSTYQQLSQGGMNQHTLRNGHMHAPYQNPYLPGGAYSTSSPSTPPLSQNFAPHQSSSQSYPQHASALQSTPKPTPIQQQHRPGTNHHSTQSSLWGQASAPALDASQSNPDSSRAAATGQSAPQMQRGRTMSDGPSGQSNATATPNGLPMNREEWLYKFFEQCRLNLVQNMMIHIITLLQAKRDPNTLWTSHQIEAASKLDPTSLGACNVISETLKMHSLDSIQATFTKIYRMLKQRKQGHATNPPQGIDAHAPSKQPPHTTTSTAPTPRLAALRVLKIAMVYSSDPNAPMAVRSSNGQLTFVFDKSSRPSLPSSPGVLPNVPQSNIPPVPQRPPDSPWSPEAADKSRLALDIMRSLGRPQGAFGDPLSPLATSTSPVEVIESSTVNGKRRTTPDPGSATPSKKQRTEGDEARMGALPGQEQPDAIIDLATSPTSAPEQLPLVNGLVVEPRPPETAPESTDAFTTNGFDGVPEGAPETLTTDVVPEPQRAPSTTSSEAADVHQVQQSILVSGLDSDVSDPSRVHTPESAMLQSADPVPLQASSSRTPVRTPSRAKEEPLFLPSPSTSPRGPAPTFNRFTTPPVTETDASSAESSSIVHDLYDRKGKGRARDDDLGDRSGDDTSASPERGTPYILVPPLPRYAKRTKRTRSDSSLDELATWDVVQDRPLEEEDAKAAAFAEGVAKESLGCLRETPCQWSGCGAMLNCMTTLQRHLVQHAGDKEEWGTYACQWNGCLSGKFVDKASLERHLQKHGTKPLRCGFVGCDEQFDLPYTLLQHYRSTKHRNGLYKLCKPYTVPLPRLRPLPTGPLPAYVSVPCRVSMHPISKERHQWLGAKVLENIICFKWQGRRSNAAVPSRGSRRLAEKVAAAESAGMTTEGALGLMRRMIDDEYLNFTDAYDASRDQSPYDDVPSEEVSRMVKNGLVLFGGEEATAAALAPDASDAQGSSSPGAAPGDRTDGDASGECGITGTGDPPGVGEDQDVRKPEGEEQLLDGAGARPEPSERLVLKLPRRSTPVAPLPPPSNGENGAVADGADPNSIGRDVTATWEVWPPSGTPSQFQVPSEPPSDAAGGTNIFELECRND